VSCKKAIRCLDLTKEVENAMKEPRFEIFKDKNNEYRFRLLAPNGEIIATGEGYSTKSNCKDGINNVKEYAPIAQIKDLTEAT